MFKDVKFKITVNFPMSVGGETNRNRKHQGKRMLSTETHEKNVGLVILRCVLSHVESRVHDHKFIC